MMLAHKIIQAYPWWLEAKNHIDAKSFGGERSYASNVTRGTSFTLSEPGPASSVLKVIRDSG